MTPARRSIAADAVTLLGSIAMTVAVTGCSTPPVDDLMAAEWYLARGDLLGSIERLDRVPPADARYPRSRAMAQAIERRLRLSQHLFDEGLLLRAEWRDDEAVERFEAALEVWPELVAAERMRAATLARARWLNPHSDLDLGAADQGVVVSTKPILSTPDSQRPVGSHSPDDLERPTDSNPTQQVFDPAVPAAAPSVETVVTERRKVRSVGDLIAQIQRDLDAGRLERALIASESVTEGLAKSPAQARLLRVLHQRALVRYGQGALELALNDWSRLLRLDPEHAEAREFADAAKAELALR